MSLIKNICILLLSFLLASCLYSPYTKPDAIYVLSGVTKLPEGVVFLIRINVIKEYFFTNNRYQFYITLDYFLKLLLILEIVQSMLKLQVVFGPPILY